MGATLAKYFKKLGGLSKVKENLLRRLWGDDSVPFPKPWIGSSDLLKLTSQKYFDRRTRELRDELGCDIETGHILGEHAYRLRSPKLNSANPRKYLTASQKRQLFSRYEFTCQICGKKTLSGSRGLQADHKIPLIRGGVKDQSNWQPICNECNVGKRGACAGCKDDCQMCPWAFPGKIGRVTLLHLPSEVLQALELRVGASQTGLEREVITLLKSSLNLP